MKLHIKNMVCDRCKMVVRAELEKLGLQPLSVELGEVELQEVPGPEQYQQIKTNLGLLGFSLVEDKKKQITESVKTAIIQLVHYNEEPLSVNLSSFLSARLSYEYSYLSAVFSEEEGTTIEKYFISQKVERAKELLTYGEKTLSEIAWYLNYSSVAHLSAQFKKITGLTPTAYKDSAIQERKSLDEV